MSTGRLITIFNCCFEKNISTFKCILIEVFPSWNRIHYRAYTIKGPLYCYHMCHANLFVAKIECIVAEQ